MKSVLFVDDERAVLDALRFAMYRDRSRWDLVFVTSGSGALDELDRRAFDVVVSDLSMPEMDGVALLERVRDKQPRAVRIILSGNVERAAHDRAQDVVHEVLSKPCPATAIRSCLERWLRAIS